MAIPRETPQCKTDQPTVDGEKAVAHITQINEGIWSRNGSRLFFGKRLPEGIVHVELMHVYDGLYEQEVRWITLDGDKHEMPFEHSDKGVIAAITAMKLTC